MLGLIKINILKDFWEIKNNKFKIIMGLLINSFVFFYLYKTMSNNESDSFFGVSFELIFIFYLIFLIIISSFSFTSNIIHLETQNGTLNHFILSPNKLITIVIIRSLIHCLKITLLISLVFIFASLILHIKVHFISIIIILFLGIISLYGIGIALSSISLLYKEIKILVSLVKVGFIYFLFKYNENLLIPFSNAKQLILNIISNNYSILEIPLLSIVKISLNSVVYFIIGIVIFKLLEKIAMKKGIEN